jgi:hypothetical protein
LSRWNKGARNASDSSDQTSIARWWLCSSSTEPREKTDVMVRAVLLQGEQVTD